VYLTVFGNARLEASWWNSHIALTKGGELKKGGKKMRAERSFSGPARPGERCHPHVYQRRQTTKRAAKRMNTICARAGSKTQGQGGDRQ